MMQNRRQFVWAVIGLGVLLGIDALHTGAPEARAAAPPRTAKLTCSETFRQETRSEETLNGSLTESASGGKLSISVELPFPEGGALPADADTPVTLHVGAYSFQSKLGNDPDYRARKSTARLTQTSDSPKGIVRTIVATVQIRWERDKITLKVEPSSPWPGKTIAAQEFLANSAGSVKGEVVASVRVGTLAAELSVIMQGKVQRKQASAGGISGEVVIIDLKGKSTPPSPEK